MCVRFLNELNLQHPHFKLTIEKETELLSFLCDKIRLSDNDLESSVYRKQSNTGFLLNYYAFCTKA